MFVIIDLNGHQAKVCEGDTLEVFALPQKEGETITVSPLAFYDGKELVIDKKKLGRISVTCSVVGTKRGKKVYSFKKKPKTGYKRGVGHRDHLTVVKVEKIETGKK